MSQVSILTSHPTSPIQNELTLAYTPLHGVGAEAVETALKLAGFTRTFTVASQRQPDGHFPTVRFPNPEEPGAMDAVLNSQEIRERTLPWPTTLMPIDSLSRYDETTVHTKC